MFRLSTMSPEVRSAPCAALKLEINNLITDKKTGFALVIDFTCAIIAFCANTITKIGLGNYHTFKAGE